MLNSKEKRRSKYTIELIIRILILIAVCILFPYWKKVVSEITFYLSNVMLQPFYPSAHIGHTLFLENYSLVFIDACSASSAYLLLFILIFATKGIILKERLSMLLNGITLILGMNLARVFILITVLVNAGANYFESLHILFWKIVSTVFVFLTWVYLTKKYKIKSIPIYSDYKQLVTMLKNLKYK